MLAGKKEIVNDPRLRSALFGGVMGCLVVGKLRHADIRQAPGRIKADEISTRWPCERNNQAMSAGNAKQKNCQLDREQYATSRSEAAAATRSQRRTVGAQRTG